MGQSEQSVACWDFSFWFHGEWRLKQHKYMCTYVMYTTIVYGTYIANEGF